MKKALLFIFLLYSFYVSAQFTNVPPSLGTYTAFRLNALPVSVVMPDNYQMPDIIRAEIWQMNGLEGIRVEFIVPVILVQGQNITASLTPAQVQKLPKNAVLYFIFDKTYVFSAKLVISMATGTTSKQPVQVIIPEIGKVKLDMTSNKFRVAEENILSKPSPKDPKANIKVPGGTISKLRSQPDTAYKSFYITDRGKEGFLYLDPSDSSTPDDSLFTVVSSGKRFKRVTDFVTPEMFGAKGDGVTNDYAAIQKAFNSRFKKIVFRNKTTYKVNSSLVLDITSRIVEGNGSTLDFTSLKTGNGLHIRGLTYPTYNAAGESSLRNIVLLGNGKEGNVTGLLVSEPSNTGAIAACLFENIAVHLFGTALKLGDRQYINTYSNLHLYSNGTAIESIRSSIDAGANNRFINSSFSGNLLAISLHRDGTTTFTGCSVGENASNVMVTYGSVAFQNCHFEGNNYSQPPIQVVPLAANAISAFVTFDNCSFVINGGTRFPPSYFYLDGPALNFTNDQMKTILVSRSFFSGFNAIPILCGGAESPVSRFVIEKSQGYWNIGLPVPTHMGNNMLADGSFEDPELSSDLIFIESDNAFINNRLSGSNIKVTPFSADHFIGARCIKLTKSGGVGTKAGVVVAVPCKPNTMYKASIMCKQTGSAKGTVNIGMSAGKILKPDNVYVVKHNTNLYWASTAIKSVWTKVGLNDFAFRTKASDTHVYLYIGMDEWGAGELLLDDFQLYEY